MFSLKEYVDNRGKIPFRNWLSSLKDKKTQAIIDARLTRVRLGNFGDCKSLKDGVFELRIDFGAGYRVYFAKEGKALVLLLLGGDKRTQSKDIESAKKYWLDYKERSDET
jgi:putative addiction module killer protein